MGVMVMEMFLARSGNAVFAIMLHAGQQEVAMKLSFPEMCIRDRANTTASVCVQHFAEFLRLKLLILYTRTNTTNF